MGALSRISLVAHTVSYKARSVCLLTPAQPVLALIGLSGGFALSYINRVCHLRDLLDTINIRKSRQTQRPMNELVETFLSDSSFYY